MSEQLQSVYGQDISRIGRKICQMIIIQRLLQSIVHFFYLSVIDRMKSNMLPLQQGRFRLDSE